VSKIARIPADFCDPQLLHYDAGQRFNAHYDWLKLADDDKTTSQRVLTILLYLNDVDDGGETIFPSTSEEFLKSNDKVFDESLCSSHFDFLRVKPRAGSAALFYNLFESGHMSNKVDHKSIHAGCPFKSGEKWAVNYWFYNRQPSINMMETPDYSNIDPSSMHTT
jgi:prolyl 4-hydroxylase